MKTTWNWKTITGLVLHVLVAGIMILAGSAKVLGLFPPEAVAKLQQVSLLSADDEPAEHKKKIEAIRVWWDQHGHLYHQWWRAWSSKCE